MKTVLIVEDDELISGIYRTHLEREGYSVELAHDGEVGMQRFAKVKPNLVLLDLMMPKVSGVSVLAHIRSQIQNSDVPVIVFSNSFEPKVIQAAKEAGATKILSKASTRFAELVAAVKQACPPDPHPMQVFGSAPAAPPAKVAEPQPEAVQEAMASHTELRRRCLNEMPERLSAARNLFQVAVKTESPEGLVGKFQELFYLIHGLTNQSSVSGLARTAQICSALEALLKELQNKPKYINPSSLRTIAQALDFLETLVKQGVTSERDSFRPALILVVDDDVISRQAIRSALEKAQLKSIIVDDAAFALRLCEENRFDLVLSDVDMPNMDGFRFCTELRGMRGHERTPFIFVTNLTDFEARTRSILSGGNDLIAKPFLLIDLAVKALTHALKNQMPVD